MHIIIFQCRCKLMVKIPPPKKKYVSYGHTLYKQFFNVFYYPVSGGATSMFHVRDVSKAISAISFVSQQI